MVVAANAASIEPSRTMLVALAAAANQTGGCVMCISSELNELQATRNALGAYHALGVEFVIDVKTLLLGDYKDEDFVLVDCTINNAKEVF